MNKMKIKHGLSTLFFIFFPILLFSQEVSLSLKTQALINEYTHQSKRTSSSDSSFKEQTVKAIIEVSNLFDRKNLDALSANIGSDLGTILTIEIPTAYLQELTLLKGILHIRVAMPVKPRLDIALNDIQANLVHLGTELESPYTGNGVIVGIIDTGLDFTHPMFRSSTTNKLRISRAWLQSEKTGAKPIGFYYGSEYIGENDLLNKKKSTENESHGTHVTGIAAGSGGNTVFKGVAPDAEIVFVEFGNTEAEIIDAVKYIFKYAKSKNKPAVVNLSLGSHSGPHDGTSYVDKAFDDLSGKGKIIVGAAGNEGNDKLHIQHYFSSVTDTLRTIIGIDTYENEEYESNVDIWGDANSNINYGIEIYNLTSKQIVYFSDFGYTNNKFKIDKEWTVEDKIIKIRTSSIAKYPTNNKPNIELTVNNPAYEQYGIAVVLIGTRDKKIDLWNAGIGYGAHFQKITNTQTGGWTSGDSFSTVGEIGGTGKKNNQCRGIHNKICLAKPYRRESQLFRPGKQHCCLVFKRSYSRRQNETGYRCSGCYDNFFC